jgi:hypothetical protein
MIISTFVTCPYDTKTSSNQTVCCPTWLPFDKVRLIQHQEDLHFLWVPKIALGGLVVSVLATGPKVRGFDPNGFLRVIKIRSTTSFGGEVKPSVPCRRFTACKRTLRTWIELVVSVSRIQEAISHPRLPARWLWQSHRDRAKTCAVSEPVTHYRMHICRPGNLRDKIPKEGGFGCNAMEEEETPVLLPFLILWLQLGIYIYI